MRDGRFAWIGVWLSVSLLGGLESWLTDAIGETRAVGVFGVGGIVIGWLWYQAYPRPLADRLLLFAGFFALGTALAFIPGGEFEGEMSPRGMIYLGILAGLVYNEQRLNSDCTWSQQGRTAMSTRRSSKELR